ncbi:hypothetical protein Pmani_024286 [Petrolisthes manimaculis]|uniref:Uncharacterized protein n=1 Tax=Petrolisthes manimaculis TaxID=1843537 RepID=A0AAE1U074_9EUCA|nr:hypothetical protein Pmani_024286 [Petrolisthes manimaculis]
MSPQKEDPHENEKVAAVRKHLLGSNKPCSHVSSLLQLPFMDLHSPFPLVPLQILSTFRVLCDGNDVGVALNLTFTS